VRHVLDPLQWGEDGEELLATGVYHLDKGDAVLGEACLRRTLELSRWPAARRRALIHLAGHHRRGGREEQAAQVWQRYRDEFPHCEIGWVELAKHHEHTTKDLEQALALTEAAPGSATAAIAHRRQRLLRRIARARRHSNARARS